MITLYQPPAPPAPWRIPNLSPFCAKLETYLRMANIQYKAEAGDPRKAPKGKIPYIADGEQLIGDSGLIIQHLEGKQANQLDAGLDPAAQARGHLARRTVEENLYFAMAYLRWTGEDSWPHVREFFLNIIPLPRFLAGQAIKMFKKDFLKKMHGQGIARHSRDEVLAILKADLDALSTLLGDQPYFLGEVPRTVDATIFGFLVNLHGVPWNAPDVAYLRSRKNLLDYVERMRTRYFPELAAKA